MGYYRKKPVVVEAIQFKGIQLEDIDVALEFDDWIRKNQGERRCKYVSNKLMIPTLEGLMEANPGDWIIRGVQGELYPCKPDIFEATYEVAPEVLPK